MSKSERNSMFGIRTRLLRFRSPSLLNTTPRGHSVGGGLSVCICMSVCKRVPGSRFGSDGVRRLKRRLLESQLTQFHPYLIAYIRVHICLCGVYKNLSCYKCTAVVFRQNLPNQSHLYDQSTIFIEMFEIFKCISTFLISGEDIAAG